MMYKRLLAAMLGMLLLMIAVVQPGCARADLQRVLVLLDTEGNEALQDAEQMLIRTALYANWNCDFLNAWDDFDPSLYSDIILCIRPDSALPEASAALLRESGTRVFVIGSGGLSQVARTRNVQGSVVLAYPDADGSDCTILTGMTGIELLDEWDENGSGTVYVDSAAYPLCASAGQVTHLAAYVPGQQGYQAFLVNRLQSFMWVYSNEPTAYGQYIVLDNVYPFSDLEQLMAVADMLQELHVRWNICVMPFYTNLSYPSVKRFCEFLSYAQSKGAGIILHVPLISLQNLDIDHVRDQMTIAYEAYAAYGIYPVALEMPEEWALTENGLKLASGWRTILLYSTDGQTIAMSSDTNPAYREGHQIVAPAYTLQTAFTSAYAQAIYLDPNTPVEELREEVLRLKGSKRALLSLNDQQNVVYVGEHYVRTDGTGNLTADGQLVNVTYKPFSYDDGYTYDKGFIQYMTQQIETSNRAILIFVAIACTFFVTAIILSRKAIRRQLLHSRYLEERQEDGGGEV